MPRAFSDDFRERIINDSIGGMSKAAAGRKWDVSYKYVLKITKHYDETGEKHLPKSPRNVQRKLSAYQEALNAVVAQHPDAALAEIKATLGVDVCIQTIANELHRLKITYKKKCFMRRNKSVNMLPASGGNGK